MEVPISAIAAASIAVIISIVALAAGLNYVFPLLSGLNSVEFPTGPNTSAVVLENGGKTFIVISNLKKTPVSVSVLAGCNTGYHEENVRIDPNSVAVVVFDGVCGVTINDGGVEYSP